MPFDDTTKLLCLGPQLLKARERLVFAYTFISELHEYVETERYPDLKQIAQVLSMAKQELEVIP